jgi:hypothetical protein
LITIHLFIFNQKKVETITIINLYGLFLVSKGKSSRHIIMGDFSKLAAQLFGDLFGRSSITNQRLARQQLDQQSTYTGIRLIDGLINNVNNNYRFYVIKILLDLVTDIPILKDKYLEFKYSKIALMFLCASTVNEMLSDTEITPKGYRTFLSKCSNFSRNDKIMIHTDTSFCHQVHEGSQCKSTLSDCLKTNFAMFLRNCRKLGSFYGKLYLIPALWILRHNPKKSIVSYVINVTRSTISLSLFYFVSQSYLSIVDKTSFPPKKIHFHFSIMLGSLCLLLVEAKPRLGMINQFMLTIYLNMFFLRTLPKSDNCWKRTFPFLLIISFMRRGLGKTLISVL